MSTLGALRIGATVLVAGLVTQACFDSDQKFVAVPSGSTSTGPEPTTDTSTGSMVESSSSGAPPPTTCRDTLTCTLGCVLAMTGGQANQIDVIFGCLLECEPPTVPEAVDVFRLIECVTADCIDQGKCDILLPTSDTSTGGSSSSTGDSSSSSGSSSDSGSTGSTGSTGGSSGSSGSSSGSSSSSSGGSSGEPPIDPQVECISCILPGLSEPSMLPMDYACYDEAVACM